MRIEGCSVQVERASQGRWMGELEEAQGPEVDGENVARLPDSIPDEAEEISREEPAVRAVPDPGEPTLEERARHALTHLPFRPWCEDCVSGRASDDPHRRAARQVSAGGFPKVSVDYGFIAEDDGDEDGGVQRTILVVKVSGSKVIMARCVQGKGRAERCWMDGGSAAPRGPWEVHVTGRW